MRELADTGALRAFVAVADARSFSAGAKRAGMTRSAASKAIVRLEELLGARLLHRTTRRVGLTAEGHAFHEQAARVLADLAEAQASIGQVGHPRGTLRVTAPEAFGRQIVLPLLGTFVKSWPGLAVEASFTDRIVDLVEEGFDLAIRFGEVAASSELLVRVVGHTVGHLCASPAYLSRYPVIDQIGDLERHRQLLSGSTDRPRGWTLRTGEGMTVTVPAHPTLLCDNAGALRDAALAGLGVACLPNFLINDDLATGGLHRLLPNQGTPEIAISVLYPSRRQLPLRVRLFIDLLIKNLPTNL